MASQPSSGVYALQLSQRGKEALHPASALVEAAERRLDEQVQIAGQASFVCARSVLAAAIGEDSQQPVKIVGSGDDLHVEAVGVVENIDAPRTFLPRELIGHSGESNYFGEVENFSDVASANCLHVVTAESNDVSD